MLKAVSIFCYSRQLWFRRASYPNYTTEGGEIRASFFNDAADKHFQLMEARSIPGQSHPHERNTCIFGHGCSYRVQ